MNELRITEYKGIRVLTTQQIAKAYETDRKVISYNFNQNYRFLIQKSSGTSEQQKLTGNRILLELTLRKLLATRTRLMHLNSIAVGW